MASNDLPQSHIEARPLITQEEVMANPAWRLILERQAVNYLRMHSPEVAPIKAHHWEVDPSMIIEESGFIEKFGGVPSDLVDPEAFPGVLDLTRQVIENARAFSQTIPLAELHRKRLSDVDYFQREIDAGRTIRSISSPRQGERRFVLFSLLDEELFYGYAGGHYR